MTVMEEDWKKKETLDRKTKGSFQQKGAIEQRNG